MDNNSLNVKFLFKIHDGKYHSILLEDMSKNQFFIFKINKQIYLCSYFRKTYYLNIRNSFLLTVVYV